MPCGITAPTAPAARRSARGNLLAHPFARFNDVLVVAGEELVATVAAEDHLDVLRRQFRDHIGRNSGRIAERLVEIPGKVLDDLHDVWAQHAGRSGLC
jgi:hypothetical protein